MYQEPARAIITLVARKTRATPKRTSTRRRAGTAKRKTAARAAATKATRKRKTPPRPSKAATLARAAAGRVVAIAQKLSWSKSENDPFVLLETDHRRFEELLKQGEETTSRAVKQRTQLLEQLTERLNLHELIEEKVLYPALRRFAETRQIVLEGFEEHHVADVVVNELHALAKDDERWAAKFKVLKENIEHHIQEEERNMFPVARTLLTREQQNALGAQMKALKG
jgi:hemerythrin-like domain-containing protein